jgi:multidrug efflux pump subunit AcrA (membrane-fusion protein)
MTSQARLSRAARRGLLAGGVAVILAVGGVITAVVVRGGGTASASTGATTTTVARGTVTVDVAAAGTVQASQTRGLSFSTAGTVTVLSVKAGDTVTAGQVLAQIDPSDAQSAVDDAQTAVTTAEQNLSDAQAAVTAAASASAAAAAAKASPAPTASGRNGPGANPGGGANPTSGSGQNQRASTGTDAVYQATVQLNNAKLTLLQAQRKLTGCTITAPIAGTVLAVNGTLGATENPGSTAFLTVGSVADAQIKAEFSEADVAKIAIGQVATITLPNQAGTVAGKVSSVDPAGTASSNLVRYAVMVGFDQAPASLLYGQSADVTVTTASASDVLYVSSSAVRDIHGNAGTVTVRTNGHDTPRTVQVGLRGDRYTEITSSLSEGETVVISNGG